MGIVIAIIIIAIIGGLISAALKSGSDYTPEDIGKEGEEYISKTIADRIEYGEYLIDDVIIPGKNGNMTAQIDHILISSRGIFVIETKSHSGRIYGSDKREQWTQILGHGEKHKFYSPVKQNEVHISKLRDLLKKHNVQIYNCVVFTKADISNVDSINVFNPYDFKRFVHNIPQFIIPQKEVDEITSEIMYYKVHPIETNEEHAAKVKAAQKDYEEGRCPRCGGTLVLRHNRAGQSFYGCSNYPKCKFTKSNKKP